nr:MAG TPA: hypothetical protein [Caudoviricetes sp.]
MPTRDEAARAQSPTLQASEGKYGTAHITLTLYYKKT